MFDYTVMTEKEAMGKRFELMKDGDYNAVVEQSDAKVSPNSGNKLIELSLSVYDESGKKHFVKDFLVFTDKMMWKPIHFFESAGLKEEYEQKKLSHHIIEGKNVRVRISTQVGSVIPKDKLNGKPEGSTYPDRNIVIDYILNKKTLNENEFDSDLPF